MNLVIITESYYGSECWEILPDLPDGAIMETLLKPNFTEEDYNFVKNDLDKIITAIKDLKSKNGD